MQFLFARTRRIVLIEFMNISFTAFGIRCQGVREDNKLLGHIVLIDSGIFLHVLKFQLYNHTNKNNTKINSKHTLFLYL